VSARHSPVDLAFLFLKGFPAKFAGNCTKCGQLFPVGADIVPDGRGGYAHDRKCAVDPVGRRY